MTEPNTPTDLVSVPTERRPDDGRCKDHDDECVDVSDKFRCFCYDPARGRCPLIHGEN